MCHRGKARGSNNPFMICAHISNTYIALVISTHNKWGVALVLRALLEDMYIHSMSAVLLIKYVYVHTFNKLKQSDNQSVNDN